MNRKNYILLTALLIVTQLTYAQMGSPYSQYGAGDMNKGGYGQSQAMGGIGVALRSNGHLNDLNPAGYTALDSNSVIYELGFSGGFNNVQNSEASEVITDTRIDFFGLGFRAARRWFCGINVINTTDIDYILQASQTNDINGDISTYYTGNGGIYKIYWANGFQITKNLSLGINVNYNFGSLNKIKTIVFEDDYTSFPSKYEEQISLNGFTFDYGLQYTIPFKENTSLTLGATYSNPWQIKATRDVVAGTVSDSRTGDGEPVIDDLINGSFTDTIQIINNQEGKINLPQSIAVGITLAKLDKFIIGADFHFKNSSKFESISFNDPLNDQFLWSVGAEFTPDKNSMSSYLKRTRYRIGGHYNQTHLRINEQNINDYGMSFGLGLPLRKTNTSFNITFELGQRGSTEQNLIKETYGILSLNLSLSDIWFLKRKYN